MTWGQRFARLATALVVRLPLLWPALRGPLRGMFDRLASTWKTRIGPDHVSALELAVARLEPPRRVLDLGTGTGVGATMLARHFPEAEVVGVDLSPAMVVESKRMLPPELAPRVRFEVGDASALRVEDGAFDLVVLVNMIPFFDELARVTAPSAAVAISFSRGGETPIYVPFDRLRRELARRGFSEFGEFAAGTATALLAKRG